MKTPSPNESISEGYLLWEPSNGIKSRSNISRYINWLGAERNLRFGQYDDLWEWSVENIEDFWGSIWDYFSVESSSPYTRVISQQDMPYTQWFEGSQLNYAEHALRRRDDHPAIKSKSEIRPLTTISYGELYERVGAVAAGLKRLGVKKDDRVAVLMPNIPETVIAFLAVSSLGATWSACSPEFGTRSVVDRFLQIEPKILLAVDGYRYGGRDFHKLEAIIEIQKQLPSLENTVILPYLSQDPNLESLGTSTLWSALESDPQDLKFEQLSFDHPLWVLYSSGTTGLPKPIVHGQGGILLEHLKVLSLHLDLKPDDRFFWFTTTGWMMWNFLIGGLLHGTTIVLYDGDPAYPDMNILWQFAEESGITYFGTAAPFIQACMKSHIEPKRDFDTSRIRSIGSTGSPLPPEGFNWVYENVNHELLLASFSGGTDLCTGFVGSCYLLPVNAGEIQCRCLGARVESYNPKGDPIINQVGELVITRPMPSMPIYFLNDIDGKRYKESYFDTFPGIWRHGDWIKITERGTCVIYGRSDSTLNRGGVRMGTSEFYRVVEEMDEITDSIVVDTGSGVEEGKLLLFVVLQHGLKLENTLSSAIISRLRSQLSPRHTPDNIYEIASVPKTLNNKKLEVPVKKVLLGMPPSKAINKDAMSNPDSLDFFAKLAGTGWHDVKLHDSG